MTGRSHFSADRLKINCAGECERISDILQRLLAERFNKRGFVLGLSGGIDSSVVGALCVRAVGKEHVLGLLMPEMDSSSDTLYLSRVIADHLGIETVHQDITGILDAVGCYRNRDDAIRSVIPEYTADYKCKIVLPSILEGESYRIFSVIVESPDGEKNKKRLSTTAYLGILSASNFKQRVRKMLEYYHADRLNYAVAGTPNRLEYDQGFFVKLGDGAADTKPIAHLYKTQVYQMAEYLGVPAEIRERPPTTDTYSMPQSQEEFFFSLPYDKMDLCLYGKNHDIPIEEVAAAADLTVEQVERVYRDIDSKRKATRYLHSSPVLMEEVAELPS
jgi:NAD+ synthase